MIDEQRRLSLLLVVVLIATGCSPSRSGCTIDSSTPPMANPIELPPAFGQYPGKRAVPVLPQPLVPINPAQIGC
jgi:hypothetical protein